jgi:hypothetical protein
MRNEVIVAEDVDEEEKLLIVLEWQWFDIFLEQIQVPDCLINDLFLRQFLLKIL